MKTVALAMAAALAIGSSAQAQVAPVVTIAQGKLSGETRADGTRVFRGIPYAKAPVGDLRWKPPVVPGNWTGVRAAQSPGPACLQPASPPASIYYEQHAAMSEDCLTLNVWTPENARNAPVMVWIHGGSLVSGSGGSPIYDGAKLASRGVIVVTINYRLGILGYLAHPSLSAESPHHVSGNYGLLDQIQALKWVRANIARFNGNPGNVTIVGESAGGLSVSALMASPLARGLYSKAIAESSYIVSSPLLSVTSRGTPSAESVGLMASKALNAPDAASLRAIPAETLVGTAAKLGYAPWLTIDGYALKKQIADTFDAGEQARVPLLAGFNSGEIRSMRFLAPPMPADAAAYEKAIRANYGELADTFLRLYPASQLEDSVLAATRDGVYGWTAQYMVDRQTAAGQSAYLYFFDHSYPAADRLKIPGFHAAEVPYVFGRIGPGEPLPPNWPLAPNSTEEMALSAAIMDYWTGFVRTGKPTAPGQPAWPRYASNAAYMRFGDTPLPGTGLLAGAYALQDEVICRRRQTPDQPWLANIGASAGVIPSTPCKRPAR